MNPRDKKSLDAFFERQQARFQLALDARERRIRERLEDLQRFDVEVRGNTAGPCLSNHPKTEGESDE